MKNHLLKSLLLLTIITSTNFLFAQRTIPEKGDNLITIYDTGNAEENFQSFGKFLVLQGYTFESKDADFLVLTTNESNSKGSFKYTLSVSFVDSAILIRVRCNYLLLGSTIGNPNVQWGDWSYAKSKGSVYGMAYAAFEPKLRNYNGTLYFSKI